jgi:hypothetical protein
VHGQGVHTCAPLMKGAYKEEHTIKWAAVAGHAVGMGCVHMRPSLGAQTRACTVSGRRVYMAYPPHLKLPSLFLLALCLAPAKCFAWI